MPGGLGAMSSMVVAYARAGRSNVTLVDMIWTTVACGAGIETRLAMDPALSWGVEEQQPCSFAAAPQSCSMAAQHAISAEVISAAVTHVADNKRISVAIMAHPTLSLDRLSRFNISRL